MLDTGEYPINVYGIEQLPSVLMGPSYDPVHVLFLQTKNPDGSSVLCKDAPLVRAKQ